MAVTAVLTGAGLFQQHKSAKQQKKASQAAAKSQKVQQRIADIRSQRERQRQASQARVLQAQQIAGGFGAGIGSGSSAVMGAVGSLGSQAASNIGFSSGIQGLSQQASIFNMQSAGLQSKAATSSAYGNMFMQGASLFGPSVVGGGGGGQHPREPASIGRDSNSLMGKIFG